MRITTAFKKVIPLTCHPETLVKDIKAIIHGKEDILADFQLLTYNGMQPDDSLTLRDLGIREGSFLRLTLAVRDKTDARGVMLYDGPDKILGDRMAFFSDEASPGRVAGTSANVECSCKCIPTHRVICPKGIGILNATNDTLSCLNCGQSDRVTPFAVGFRKCKFRFHEIKASNGMQQTTKWEAMDNNRYHLVDPQEDSFLWRHRVMEIVSMSHVDTCTICVQLSQNLNALSCGHRFHASCISKWDGPCPYCLYNKHLTVDPVVASRDR